MRISIFGVKDWEREYLEGKFSSVLVGNEVSYHEGIVTESTLPPEDTEILSVFVDSSVSRAVIEKLPNLKMIATRSTGFDHIDLVAAKEKNIAVTYVPSYGENTVAEFAFALILALARKLYQSIDIFRETGRYSYDGLMGFDLKGKTIGIIGTGRIGMCVIKMAKGFDMNVVAFDLFPNKRAAEELNFPYLTFEEVLKQSDIVTLHIPYSKDNHHLINEKSIQLMKKGALLINTSRGPLIDTLALVSALEGAHLGGAGLDVLEEEGVLKDEKNFLLQREDQSHDTRAMIANHVLADMDNVLITPHTAFNTREAIIRILDTTLDNIGNFTKGELKNVVPQ